MRCCGPNTCEHALRAGNGLHVSGSGRPGDPWVVDSDHGRWRTDFAASIFSAGVTIGNGVFFDLRWRRRPDPGGYELDYQGAFRLGSSSAVTGSVDVRIPGSHAIQTGIYASGAEATFYDRSGYSHLAGFFAAPGAAAITLFRASGGYVSSSQPFVWAQGDVIRWDICGLLVV